MKNKIETKLHDIRKDVELLSDTSQLGLMNGIGGSIIFLSHYAKYFDDEKSNDLAVKFLSESFNQVENQDANLNYTFCTGLAGIGWTLEYLNRNDFVEIDLTHFRKSFDNLILTKSLINVENRNFDYLHGGFGTIPYLIDSAISNQHLETIDRIEAELEKTSFEDNETCYWESPLQGEDENQIEIVANLGLAHGVTGLVLLLCYYYPYSLSKKRTQRLIAKTLAFILNCKLHPNFDSTYAIAKGHQESSRLGWCYGDMGIALAFLKSGKLFKNELWLNEAITLMLKTSTRIGEKQSTIRDAAFCHGAAGMAQIFRRFSKETKNEQFSKSTEYWVDQILNMAYFKESHSGYKKLTKDGYEFDVSLLTGISGIGLVLLDYLSDDMPSWDDCFLLN